MFKAIKLILDLQKENVLLRRAINDATVMLSSRKRYMVLTYEDKYISCFMSELYRMLSDFNKIQQPTNNAEDKKCNPDNCFYYFP